MGDESSQRPSSSSIGWSRSVTPQIRSLIQDGAESLNQLPLLPLRTTTLIRSSIIKQDSYNRPKPLVSQQSFDLSTNSSIKIRNRINDLIETHQTLNLQQKRSPQQLRLKTSVEE